MENIMKKDMKISENELVKAALEAMKSSYSPYSGYTVGAALLTDGGKIYLGANIENASYSPTVCAERVAFFKAVNEGERDFRAIAVCGGAAGDAKGYFTPCGVCRQVMAEFCSPDFEIILCKSDGEYKKYTLAELLPAAFSLK